MKTLRSCTSADDTRKCIVEVATRVFALHGFQRTPLSLIALEAGVSKSLILWYFGSKDNLVLEVARRVLPLDIVSSCLGQEDLGAQGLLECIGSRYLRKYSSFLMASLLLQTISLENTYTEIRTLLDKLCNSYVREIARRVFGEPLDKEKVARIRMFMGSLLCYSLRPIRGVDASEYLESLIRLIMR